MHRTNLVLAAAVALLASLVPSSAIGQEPGVDGWRFSVGPYLWISSVGGDRTVPSGTTPIQFGGSTLFGGRTSLGVQAEVGKGRWSLMLDGLTVRAADEIEPLESGAAGFVGRSELSLTRGEVLVGRRLGSGYGPTGLELYGGVRYTSLRQGFGDGTESVEIARRWIDPLVTARFVSRPDGGVGFVTSWEVGGFGVGSQFSWGIETGLIFQWSERLDLSIGYRLSDVDYEQDIGTPQAFVYNGTLRGLRSRLSVRF